jgi:pimeloyl-ACP methyl ester carboxylesterase
MHIRIMRGSYEKSLNWYRALARNVNQDDELQAPQLDPRLHMPVLMLTEKPSAVSLPGFAEQIKQFADDVTMKEVSTSGHWVQLEARDELNDILEEFIKIKGTK